MNNIEEVLEGISSMGIAGHIRPDGDAVCSCLALYLYVKKYHPEIACDVYLDHPRPVFGFLPGFSEVKMTEENPEQVYDLFVTCDVAALDRLSLGAKSFPRAMRTVCIDHHVSNPGFAQINHVRGSLSSCAEVLYTLMDPQKVDKDLAMVIYTGIVHDTGVFQYSNTSPETMRVAAKLMETGIDTSRIISETFDSRTYVQLQVMGRVLTESILIMDGKVIVGYLRKKDMDFYGVN
ncbi:MAG: DHH family phosphoesterase, partial [Blautia sp.]|nr:DHH family phosphoesterase [Blautia sp.]